MVELIPRGVLFGNPERVSPRISPDGTRLAWLAPVEGVLNVWVANLAEAGPEGRPRGGAAGVSGAEARPEEPGPDGRPGDMAGPEGRPVEIEGAPPLDDP